MADGVGGVRLFFFFQAEDGIRDLTVTGVQTCALPILPTFAASTDADGIVMNLYEAGSAKLKLRDGTDVAFTTETKYPADGLIRITVSPSANSEFAMKLRIPSWCPEPRLEINGKQVPVKLGSDGYAVIHREWKTADLVTLRFK